MTQPPSVNQQLQQFADTQQANRWGRYVLLLFVMVLLLWASLVPIDSGVPAQGVIGIEQQRQAVQHWQGGIVKKLLVKEGDQVQQGQLLLALDDTQIRADLQRAEQAYGQYQARLQRLLAEREQRVSLTKTNHVEDNFNTQAALLTARQQTIALEKQVLSEQITSKKLDIQRQQAITNSRQQQVALLAKEIDAHLALIKQGYNGQERLLELQREQLEKQDEQQQAQLMMVQLQADIRELQQQILLRQAQYQQDIEQEMTQVQERLTELEQQKASLADRLKHTQIIAPATGMVLSQTIHTQGGVVNAGQVLMDIVPPQQTLMVDAKVAPHLIEKVQLNQLAHIRLVALNSLNPVVEAKVIYISPDQITPTNNSPAYFAVRLAINPQSLKSLKYQKISAGMPAEVLLKTGERTFIRYLAEPLLKTLFFALKET
ncbi:MAG TPA: HlyD family type I secretion periplasmic adaptor subunit [Agitococcus sp.]|nr:HlyD family type I secretion periplasmic adaptor subunit [Agitococcus sp.]